ncbi:putative antirepressor - phage associated [Streptomyces noursei]|nr:putative antirepressor - phage associated [Streptomyces noursei]
MWFVAGDVCRALGLSGQVTNHLRKLPARHKGLNPIKTPGGVQQLNCVSEPGMYSLIFRSDKPEAREFEAWVTEDVLPSIRKTGSYQTEDPMAAFPGYVRDAFMRMAEENKTLKVENAELHDTVSEQAPLVARFREFTDTEDSASSRDVARLLDLKERRFTGLMREWGWMEKLGTAATAKAREKGWMVNRVVEARYGARPVQGRVTSRGFEAIVRKLEVA